MRTLYLCLVLLLHSVLALTQYSDDFSSTSGINRWQVFQSGDSVYYQSLMYSDSLIEGGMLTNTEGRLVMICGATYWYANVTGPYIYQLTWGDFSATTRVWSFDRNDTSVPPQFEYNSTGLILRNPDVSNGQNYVMTNLGMQAYSNGLGSESKTTVDSESTLYLDPDEHEGEVRITRTGSVIRTYKRTGTDTAFVLLDEFDRPDIPDTVQIGMVLNGYTDTPDIRGEFDHIYFDGGDCRIVRNTMNTGTSSLRNAISCAVDGDTIFFDHAMLTDTIDLTTGPLEINKDLVLINDRSMPVFIQGSAQYPVVTVFTDVVVTMQGLAFSTQDPAAQVMLNLGTLTLIDCSVNAGMPTESSVTNQGVLTIRGHCDFR